MDVITQNLVVQDWPFKKVGDKLFLGYIVAMGVVHRDWGEPEGCIQYVDFAYNDRYCRYRLPSDPTLKSDLFKHLRANLDGCASEDGIYRKLWISRTEGGYSISLP